MAGQRRDAVRAFYSPLSVASEHDFDTTRKARWVADSLAARPVPGFQLIEPPVLTDGNVATVHAPEYVDAVRTGQPRELAESQGFTWGPRLWSAVLAANGGLVAAALAALDEGCAGTLSSGFHHARYRTGAGFCTFNGLVIAARAALAAGAGTVLILDLDAHCGGGTASLIQAEDRIWQCDVSVCGYDHYVSRDPRIHLDVIEQPRVYLDVIRRRLDELDLVSFDLCLYNAGMDPFEKCSIGGLRGLTRDILSDRERIVFDWCASRALPIAFNLAGGYVSAGLDQDGLVELHRLTFSSASQAFVTPPASSSSPTES